jgi:exopolysaccharide biosynthesis polyprenyl glycosylphosphotransferase
MSSQPVGSGPLSDAEGAADGTAERRRRAPISERGGGRGFWPRRLPPGAERDLRRRDALFRRSLGTADALAVAFAIGLTQVLVHGDLRVAALLAIPFVVVAAKAIGLYDRDELVLHKTTLDEAPALFQLATLYALCVSLLGGFLFGTAPVAGTVVVIWLSLFALTLLARFSARRIARAVAPEERCLVVGDLRGTGAIGRRLRDEASLHARLMAEIPLDFEGDREAAAQQLRAAIVEHQAHRVILAPRTADSDAVLDAVRLIKSMGVKVSLLPRLLEVVGTSVVFDDVSGATVLGVRRFGLTHSSALLKRSLDLAVAGGTVLLLGPLMLVIAAAVKLDARGPVLFRQVRVGRGGQHFEMLKFRSMVDGADALKADLRGENESSGLFKIAGDPRITTVGRLLRATSLDELPQLLNVVRGHMSLVGPRPLVVDEDRLVEGWDRRRLHLTPGMTGPWQLLGSRRVPLDEMVKIDYLYIANWSFWTDVKLLIRTAVHVIEARGH